MEAWLELHVNTVLYVKSVRTFGDVTIGALQYSSGDTPCGSACMEAQSHHEFALEASSQVFRVSRQ